MSWGVGELSGVLRRWFLEYERLHREATRHERYSIRSTSSAVLSGVAAEKLAVVGWVVT